MSEYPTYETVGGQASEAITYSRLIEHLRLASEACATLGHLKKANGDDLIGTGFLGFSQLLDKTTTQVTHLATKGIMQ